MNTAIQIAQASNLSHDWSFAATDDMLDVLEQEAIKAGFRLLRHNPQEAVLALEQLRLKVMIDENKGFVVAGIYPAEEKLLQFLVEDNADEKWLHTLAHGVISRKLKTCDFWLVTSAIQELAASAALIKAENKIPAYTFLRPLPGGYAWLPRVSPSWIECCQHLLRNTRAICVSGAFIDLVALLTGTLSSGIYQIRGNTLVSEPEKAFVFLEQESGGLNQVSIAVNLTCLPNDAWRQAYINLACELSMADYSSGARLFFFRERMAIPDGLPDIQLPDFRSLEEQLDTDRRPENMGLRRILGRSGDLSGADIDTLIKTVQKEMKPAPFHGVSLSRPETVTLNSTISLIRKRQARIDERLRERLVGQTEIIQKISRIIPLWMAKGPSSGPLVLSFIGPSGTGKNLVCEVLAEVFAEDAFFGLSMPHNFDINLATGNDAKHWRLMGVEAGHVGAERPGLLESATGSEGYVLSLNEIDKQIGGNHDPQGLLVTVLENHGFRNGCGKFVRFSKGLIVLTMNCGLNAADERQLPIGFSSGGSDQTRQHQIAEKYEDYFKKHVIAPLRGRIHSRFIFNELTRQNLQELAVRELTRRGGDDALLGLEWFENLEMATVVSKLVAASDPSQGARGLLNEINSFHEQVIDNLLQNKV